MARSFCITIDVEPDCDTHWRRSAPLSFDAVRFCIPRFLRPMWDRYGIRPVYLVTAEVAQDPYCCEVLKREAGLGAEIGTHLHSEYIEPCKKYETIAGTYSKEYPCFAHSMEVEKAKIRNLTELIVERLRVRPLSYRAARFGADLDTIKSLENLGYRVDTSVTPHIDWSFQGGPDHTRAPTQPYFVSQGDLYAPGDSTVLEIPVTVSGKRLPFLPEKWYLRRWLRPTHMTLMETKRLVDEFVRDHDHPVLNMFFHVMEIMPGRTPYVRSRASQYLYLRRLERTMEYLLDKGFRNKTAESLYCEATTACHSVLSRPSVIRAMESMDTARVRWVAS